MTLTAPVRTGSQDPTGPFLLHRVRVAGRRRISDGFMRITFTGPTLDRFADPGLDQRIKLILPAADGSLDAMPLCTDWYARWRDLPEASRPVIRTYTTRAVRPERREVDVDLVLHEPCGPAGRFAAGCEEGDEVVLLGPNSDCCGESGGIDFRLPPSARTVLIAGDETALPAIGRILAQLPADVRGAALVEVPHAGDGALLPQHPGVRVEVLVRDGAASGVLLHPAVRHAAAGLLTPHRAPEPEDVDLEAEGAVLWEVPEETRPDAGFYAWLAGEAGMIKAMRRTLVADLGVDRRAVAFMGYWRAGRSEGA